MLQRAEAMLRQDVVNGELVVHPATISRWVTTAINSLDSRYWGLVAAREHHGKAVDHFLVPTTLPPMI